ncbi:hypothetical protein NHX12_018031 [Muraenolepis orangiensis]|uniref:Target of Myb protein 1 n=1 Tax=Muraenolepis orangiensis TaxID=630683 RepID=A0A9Q0EW08_9TELE|nr:hypothetical protein NHX12_018031 [Muraenolepis orangiensis]
MTEQQHTFYCQQLGTLLMCLIHIFKSGMFRRITAAASRLLKAEGVAGGAAEAGSFYSLDALNSMVQGLTTTHPSLVLLWCQVLLIINYTNYSWWAEVHQTPRGHSLSCTKLLSPHSSSGEGEEENPEWRLAMINREIVRRGALILFCDYVIHLDSPEALGVSPPPLSGRPVDMLLKGMFTTPATMQHVHRPERGGGDTPNASERATNAALPSEDWGLNMEICDIINETDEGPKDAVKAIKKKIVANNNFREVMLTLTVLEACVKNCGHRFHVLIAAQDFIEGVLVRAILPKYNPPLRSQTGCSMQIAYANTASSWADAFRSFPPLSGVVSVYEDLKRRGLEFPMTDLDALSPIHTPNRSIPENDATPETTQMVETPLRPEQRAAASSDLNPSPDPSERPVTLSAQQEQKLQRELALVRGNLRVMSEMISDLTPGHADLDDTELLQQLYAVCQSMQARVVELIPRLLDEGLIAELLVLNDELNNAFIRYERFDRLDKAQFSAVWQDPASVPTLCDPSPMAQEPSQASTSKATFGPSTTSSLADQRQAPDCSVAAEEFDMFAQTRDCSLAEQRRSVRYEDPGAVDGLAGALDNRLQVTGMVCVL